MTTSNDPASARRSIVRYVVLAILFVITSICYADRATISMAAPAITDELGLSPVTMGYILSSFAFAYVLFQIPGGVLLDRFGSKRVYATALICWSSFTILQGMTSLLVGGAIVAALFLTRFLMGFAEAPCFPGNARIVATWFPTSERGTASAVFNSAQYFSLVAFAPLMGWLLHSFHWPVLFFVMGGLGLVAAVIFLAFVRDPRRHPTINAAELDYITRGGALVNIEEAEAKRGGGFTWHNVRQIISSRMLIGVFVGQYCINVLTYFFATWFPIYLVDERHMSILQAGFVAAVPALFGFGGGVLGGIVSDILLRKTGSVTFARKAPLLFGMILALAIIGCNYAESQWLVVVLMTIAFFGKGVASLGWAVVSDTSPKALVGVTGGIFNMCGNAAGIVTPIVIGYIVGATGSFDGALVFVGAHCVLAVLAYFVITGKIERLELAPEAAAAPFERAQGPAQPMEGTPT